MEPTQPCEVARCFDACAAALVLFARSYVGQAEAEDLVQDAFLKAMGQNGQVRDLKAWLFQTVRNAALNHQRNERRHSDHQEAIAARQRPWFEPPPDAALDGQAARLALLDLPTAEREVVILRIWGQMTLQEVSAVTGRAVSTLHDQYQAAIEKLRQRMVPDEQA